MSYHTVEVIRTHVDIALNEGNALGWELTLSDDFELHLDGARTDATGYRALAEAWGATSPLTSIELVNVFADGERATVVCAVHDGEGGDTTHTKAHFRVERFTITEAWIGVPPGW